MKLSEVVLVVVIVRLSTFLLTRTNFVPDEYYQTLEPAFKNVFDKGIM